METYGENLLHVYDDPKSVTNDGKVLADYKARQPLMFNDYYGIGYHSKAIKIGDTISLLFNSVPVTDGTGIRKLTGIVTSIRGQFWNGNDTDNVLDETIPSYKNWVKIITIQEKRDQELNEILRTFC